LIKVRGQKKSSKRGTSPASEIDGRLDFAKQHPARRDEESPKGKNVNRSYCIFIRGHGGKQLTDGP